MKIETIDDNYEMPDSDDRDETLDLYNEDMARNAAKSLFDDDSEPEPDDDRYVTGYERPVPDKPVSEKKAYEKPAAARPRIRILDDEPLEDAEMEEEAPTYRRRERVKEPIPAPKPAVKVNAAPRGTNAVRSRAVPPKDEEDESIDDEYSSFRQRYKNREAVPGPRYQVPPRAPRAGKPRTGSGYSDGYDDGDSVSPMRWVAGGLTFVFLVVLAFLVYRIVVLSGQLKEANENGGGTLSITEAEVTQMRLANEQLNQELLEKDDEIERLRGLVTQGAAADTDTVENSSRPIGEEEDGLSTLSTPQPANQPTVYVCVTGDNLTKIAKKFYGTSTPDDIKKIKDANNLTSDDIKIGQELKIP